MIVPTSSNGRRNCAGRGGWAVYPWALMPNHFHLVGRTGKTPLARSLRRLMTGYAINFNLRHKQRVNLFL